MMAYLNAKVASVLPAKMPYQWPWRHACVVLMCCVVFYSGFTEGCPCDPIGASNSGDCRINTSFRCLCRTGYKGLNCSVCKEGYYRPVLPKTGDQQTNTTTTTMTTPTIECTNCGCNEIGSLDPECDSYGNCQCKTGVGGAKCDQCLVGFHSFNDNGCQRCDCMEIARQCHSAQSKPIKGSSQSKSVLQMCNQCIQQRTWAFMCNQLCGPNQYLQQDGSCQPCQCKPTEGAAIKRIDNRHCNIFTGKCLPPPCSKNYRGVRSPTNCTMQHYKESTTATKNWESKSTDSYLIAGVVACFLMLVICIIIIGYIIRRKRRCQRTPMPLWTIELKQEDRSSFTDYSDVDVMYLDDSYLMDSPSELFSASTDSINERIGYHTLS